MLAVPEGKCLVPVSALKGANDISEVELRYTVTLNNNTYIKEDNFKVICTNIKIGESKLYSDLVNVEVYKAPNNNKNEMIVNVIITLYEPRNKEIYLEIINKPITFQLIFSSTNYVYN